MELLQFSSECKNTLPIESRERSDDKFVAYSTEGYNNLYPNFLLDLYNDCATHAAIINSKVDYIIGKGLVYEDGIPVEFEANATDSVKELIKKVVTDYLIFGGFAVELEFNVAGDVVGFHFVPLNHIRANKSLTTFWINEDWKYTRSHYKIDRWKPGQSDGTTKLFFCKGYIPSINNVYPIPDYHGAINAIQTEMALDIFNRNNIENHFSVSTFIQFFKGRNIPDNVKRDIVNRLEEAFTGVKGKKVLVDYSDPTDKPADIKNLDPGNWDKAYIEVAKKVQDNIFIGHAVTNSEMFGISVAGRLGGTTTMQDAWLIFENGYIRNKREALESALNKLFSNFSGVKGKVKFGSEPLFKPKPSDTTKEKVMTINELRNEMGLEPIEGGDVLLTPAAQPQMMQIMPATNGQTATNKPVEQSEPVTVNDNIKNLTAKQHQQLRRIIREYSKDILTKEQATVLLKSSLGLADDEINILLGITDDVEDEQEEMKDQPAEKKKSKTKELIEKFHELADRLGASFDEFEVVKDKKQKFSRVETFDTAADIAQYVVDNDIKTLSIKELAKLIEKDLSIKISESSLKGVLNELHQSGTANVEYNDKGHVQVTPSNLPEIPDSDRVFVMYKYEKRPGVKGPDLIDGSRPFCIKLIGNNRLYNRSEIQQMSSLFGYSVFDYAGLFWHNPETGETEPQCRHHWVSYRVKRKPQN